MEHILFGVDHLLFVLCLLLLVRSVRSLLATITAFTLAHSITLALATLDVIRVPAPPVEATIALSIVFLATELARGEAGRGVATRAYPWLVAFSFGLLHGLGFAGALAEVGLPQGEVPLALFAFNVGVELGQVAFVTAVLSVGWLLRALSVRIPSWAPRAAAYAIGSVASFWVFARLGVAVMNGMAKVACGRVPLGRRGLARADAGPVRLRLVPGGGHKPLPASKLEPIGAERVSRGGYRLDTCHPPGMRRICWCWSAFSGGGKRSASFGYGALKGMRELIIPTVRMTASAGSDDPVAVKRREA